VPDTVYILTGFIGDDDCGLPFIMNMTMLISADNKVDKEIIEVKKKNRTSRQIKSNISNDTFETSTCHYTRYFTTEISKNLKKLNL
jgi:hypothetical protein